jgi:death-on-curing protein
VAAPIFLTLDEVLAIHADQVRRYGGAHGVRDWGLLSSALAMPQASFGGVYLHNSLAEMAAAYLFHLARNHPFLDGNKRAALASALAFLWLNDEHLEADEDELTELVMGVAAGRRDERASRRRPSSSRGASLAPFRGIEGGASDEAECLPDDRPRCPSSWRSRAGSRPVARRPVRVRSSRASSAPPTS